jgi:hypothetical protein
MKLTTIERLAEVAAQCADSKPYGAYVRSRFFAGGFGFATAEDAAQWVDQQATRATRDGMRNDFSAAISRADGVSVSLYS